MTAIKIVCLADTHSLHDGLVVPEGDILIHAGDLTNQGSLEDVISFNSWISKLPHKHKVVIAGNHDFCFERRPQQAEALLTDCIYLKDNQIEIEGIKIYGSPWQPWFFDWAFNLPRGGPELRARWDAIPDDTDVLITHGPPLGQQDRTQRGEPVGCEILAERARQIKPKIHVFGHIHEGYGESSQDDTKYINASICTLAYIPSNPPIVSLLD
jgi:Icc-related predicted phosphoesterase